MSVAICKEVSWESTPQSSQGIAYFPEAGLEALQQLGLDAIVRRADIQALYGEIDDLAKKERGSFADVCSLIGRPDIVLRVAPHPFSHLAINVALEHALQDTIYETPHYYAAVSSPNGQDWVSIMSKAKGTHVLDYKTRGLITAAQIRAIQTAIYSTGMAALEAVDVPTGSVAWDMINGNNLFTEYSASWLAGEPASTPMTIIDQMYSLTHTPRQWNAMILGNVASRQPTIYGQQGTAS